jgi:hypothetical protein
MPARFPPSRSLVLGWAVHVGCVGRDSGRKPSGQPAMEFSHRVTGRAQWDQIDKGKAGR